MSEENPEENGTNETKEKDEEETKRMESLNTSCGMETSFSDSNNVVETTKQILPNIQEIDANISKKSNASNSSTDRPKKQKQANGISANKRKFSSNEPQKSAKKTNQKSPQKCMEFTFKNFQENSPNAYKMIPNAQYPTYFPHYFPSGGYPFPPSLSMYSPPFYPGRGFPVYPFQGQYSVIPFRNDAFAKNGKNNSLNASTIPNISTSPSKVKPSIIPALKMQIGSWLRKSAFLGDIFCKFYYKKRQLVWEMMGEPMGYLCKMIINFQEIVQIDFNIQEDNKPSVMMVEVSKPPSFYQEVNPQPGKNIQWMQAQDFTGGQASTSSLHSIWFYNKSLKKHIRKLIKDETLKQVIRNVPQILPVNSDSEDEDEDEDDDDSDEEQDSVHDYEFNQNTEKVHEFLFIHYIRFQTISTNFRTWDRQDSKCLPRKFRLG